MHVLRSVIPQMTDSFPPSSKELLRRNNTKATVEADGEVRVTIGQPGEEEMFSTAIRSASSSNKNMDLPSEFSADPVRTTPGLRTGHTRRSKLPNDHTLDAAETSRISSAAERSFHENTPFQSDVRSSFISEIPPARDDLEMSRVRESDTASRLLNRKSSPSGIAFGESEYFPPPTDEGVIAPISDHVDEATSKFALSKLNDTSMSYLDPEMSQLSPYRRTTKAHLLRPFVTNKRIGSHIYSPIFLPSPVLSKRKGSSLHESVLSAKDIEDEEKEDQPASTSFSWAATKDDEDDKTKTSNNEGAEEIRREFESIFGSKTKSRGDADSYVFDEEDGDDHTHRRSFLKESDWIGSPSNMDHSTRKRDYKTDRSHLSSPDQQTVSPRRNTFENVISSSRNNKHHREDTRFESEFGHDNKSPFSTFAFQDSPSTRSRKRFESRLAQELYASHLQDPGSTDIFNKSRVQASSSMTMGASPSAAMRVSQRSIVPFVRQSSNGGRDPLAIDLDRFRYNPQHRALKFMNTNEPPQMANEWNKNRHYHESRMRTDDASSYLNQGGMVESVNRGTISSLRESRGFLGGPSSSQKTTASTATSRLSMLRNHYRKRYNKRERENILHGFDVEDEEKEEEDDDIGQIAKHVMDRPFSTLEALRAHFANKQRRSTPVRRRSSLSSMSSPQNENENLMRSRTNSPAQSSTMANNDELRQTHANDAAEIARLQQQLAALQRKMASTSNIHDAESRGANDDLKILTRGSMFIKTTTRGNTHRRFVYVSPDLRTVYWAPPDSLFMSSTQDVRSMSLIGARVLAGQQTIPFHRRNEFRVANKCFSIVTRHRSLDLEIVHAETSPMDVEEHRDEWVRAFQKAIDRVTNAPQQQ